MDKIVIRRFGIKLNKTFIRYDNTSTINLSKNSVQYSRSKYIEIRHHFIRDHVSNGDVILNFVYTDK